MRRAPLIDPLPILVPSPLQQPPAIAYPPPWPDEPEVSEGQTPDEDLCIVCRIRSGKATVNVPCGHACCCVTCAATGQLHKCPVCRKTLTSITRVYR